MTHCDLVSLCPGGELNPKDDTRSGAAGTPPDVPESGLCQQQPRRSGKNKRGDSTSAESRVIEEAQNKIIDTETIIIRTTSNKHVACPACLKKGLRLLCQTAIQLQKHLEMEHLAVQATWFCEVCGT